jgi:hypothetical protein
MVIRRAALLAAVLTAAFLCPPPATAADRGDEWRALATRALATFERTDNVGDGGTGGQKVMSYGLAYEASGRLRGFDDVRTRRYLVKILSMKNPDGGYGLPFAYDVLGDGTVNPATTTYTVTLADHVGSPLLAGYLAGAVPRAEVQNIVNLIMSTPRIDTDRGQCIAYSRHPNDSVPYACVHNVSAGAARFLLEAQSAGIGRSGLAALVEGVTRRETYAYLPASKNWRYADTQVMSDPDHQSYEAWSMYFLAPPVANNVVYYLMNTSFAAEWGAQQSSVIHARLTALPPALGGIAAPAASADRWCVLGDRWLPEVEAYVGALPNIDAAAQIAQLTAKAADACGPAPSLPTTPPVTTAPPTTVPTTTSPPPVDPTTEPPSTQGA